jgi:hypothetical protein
MILLTPPITRIHLGRKRSHAIILGQMLTLVEIVLDAEVDAVPRLREACAVGLHLVGGEGAGHLVAGYVARVHDVGVGGDLAVCLAAAEAAVCGGEGEGGGEDASGGVEECGEGDHGEGSEGFVEVGWNGCFSCSS